MLPIFLSGLKLINDSSIAITQFRVIVINSPLFSFFSGSLIQFKTGVTQSQFVDL